MAYPPWGRAGECQNLHIYHSKLCIIMTNDTQPIEEKEPEHYAEDDKCRHCGSYNVIERSVDDDEGDETYYFLHCKDCGKDD